MKERRADSDVMEAGWLVAGLGTAPVNDIQVRQEPLHSLSRQGECDRSVALLPGSGAVLRHW